MSEDYSIERGDGVTTIRLRRNLQLEEILRVVDEVAKVDQCNRRLWDLTECFDFTPQEIERIAERGRINWPDPSRVAYVANDDLAFGVTVVEQHLGLVEQTLGVIRRRGRHDRVSVPRRPILVHDQVVEDGRKASADEPGDVLDAVERPQRPLHGRGLRRRRADGGVARQPETNFEHVAINGWEELVAQRRRDDEPPDRHGGPP